VSFSSKKNISGVLFDQRQKKGNLFVQWKAIYDERADIIAKAGTLSTTNYTNAYNTLATYLTSTPLSF
jgi:hypothetical protein